MKVNMAVEISKFRSYRKNTLQGFADIKLTSIGLEIKDCTIHEKNGKRWVGLPARPYEDNGVTKWANIVLFYDKKRLAQFQKAVLKALDEYSKEE